MKIDDLDLSIHSYNALRHAGIDTLEQLKELSDNDFARIRNLSEKRIGEIKEKIREYSLRVDDPIKNNQCNYCNGSTNDYIILNDSTVPYGGIEISFHHKGMLRVRYYKDADYEANFESQDIVMLKVCPICGREIKP